MFVGPDAILGYEYLQSTIKFIENYNKRPNTGPYPKHWLGFSCIFSEDYGLDIKFD